MLTDLVVENLGVFETAALELSPGCSALTGETGAGKTLIVTAVSLLTGGRADAASIRPGVEGAHVEGRFLLSRGSPAAEVLIQNGIIEGPTGSERESPELEVVIARSVSRSASKARVNGRLVTMGVLGEVGRALVDVVGQHEHQRLFSSAWQRACLDAFCGDDAEDLAGEVAEAVRSLTRQQRALEELRTGDQQRARELDVLRYEIREIEAAALQQGERERLRVEITRLESSDAIAAALGRAVDAFSSEGGAEDRIEEARASLDGVSERDPALVELRARTATALHEVADIALELRARAVEPDPGALEQSHERLAVINRLCRKYGRDETEVLAYLETCRARASELAQAPVRQAEVEEAVARSMTEAKLKAGRLSRIRRKAAPRLARATEEVLAELALAGATMEVRLQECDLYEGGAETVEVLVDLNRTGDPRPIKKVASGGELSRLALALHLVATSSGASTMIFDEVDAGVGGEAARALGSCLASLARSSGGQVLVVTHLPQVAAYADNHYAVHKDLNASAGARVVRIEGEQRVAELSRMLAGLPRSDRAHEHARELLELAAQAS